jgi:RES domain-containing protein
VTTSVRTWRIATDTPAYTADDATGEGARRSGGRWNRAGVPMLYSSCSQALACLEVVVHLSSGDDLPLNRYLVAIDIPAHDWRQRRVFDPVAGVGWDARPPGRVSLDWGSEWVQSASTLIAEVPSVIVPDESNVLLNPRQPRIQKVGISKVKRWQFDRRLA